MSNPMRAWGRVHGRGNVRPANDEHGVDAIEPPDDGAPEPANVGDDQGEQTHASDAQDVRCTDREAARGTNSKRSNRQSRAWSSVQPLNRHSPDRFSLTTLAVSPSLKTLSVSENQPTLMACQYFTRWRHSLRLRRRFEPRTKSPPLPAGLPSTMCSVEKYRSGTSSEIRGAGIP